MRIASLAGIALLFVPGCSADFSGEGSITEDGGNGGNGGVATEMGPIERLQRGQVDEGSDVDLSGVVVTAVARTGVFVEQPDGGKWSGIWVYLGAPEGDPAPWVGLYHPGDVVDVHGTLMEYADSVETLGVPTVTQIVANPDDVVVTGSGDVPAPVVVDAVDLTLPDVAEAYEGVLVTVSSATVFRETLGHGQWSIEPGAVVDDLMTTFGKVYTGDRFGSITGVVHTSYGQIVLEPRSPNDFQGYVSDVVRLGDAAAGSVALTEALVHPTACPESKGQWLELVNPMDRPIDLDGLVIRTNAGRTAIHGETLLGPGDILLAANAGTNVCHQIVPDVVLPFSLGDDDDLRLVGPGGVIDEVDLHGVTLPVGASLGLDARAWDANENDDASKWCAAGADDMPIDGASGADWGSPGYPNATACF